jgi:hypothetical protein
MPVKQQQNRIPQPLRGTPVRKYFLDRSGVSTQRMGAGAGRGHYDVAREYLGAEAADLYDQMLALGFARVLETDVEIHAEARQLTQYQRRYLQQRHEDTGLPLILNSAHFIESKDPRAKSVVATLLA